MNLFILPSQYSGDPEVVSMLQAFYSRSGEGIESRLFRLGSDLSKVKEALKKYYVGYGHQSIGDCGTLTIFIEGVSILAAKAIQENPLYNGQECSTRYIELSGDMYLGSEHARWWQSEYHKVKEAVLAGVRAEHPFEGFDGFDINNHEHKKPGSDYAVWENATAARAFDIARGWIPCDALTNLSLTVSLRKASEIGNQLLGHPIEEVRQLADNMLTLLSETYPYGIVEPSMKELLKSAWLSKSLNNWYIKSDYTLREPACTLLAFTADHSVVDMINARPKHTTLPHGFENYGRFCIEGYIDYGTWRDMQRHRRNVGLPPAVRPTEMHPWYVSQVQRYVGKGLAEDIITDAQSKLDYQAMDEWDVETSQHACPLGTVVPYKYEMGLSQALYFAELRSNNTVHPILRPIAQMVGHQLRSLGIRVDNDNNPARFDVKRGTQTIVENEKESV